jgi:MYXO-CTERM domain-containing protein
MQTPARFLAFVVGPAALLLSTAHASSAATSGESALRVATPQVPLVKEGIVARIDHRYAVTDHQQVARNVSGWQAEGSYLLSTGGRSVVTRFTYWNGNEPIRGELFERDAATQMYDTVTRARRDPGVLEELSPDNYRYRIFPFETGEMKRIEVRWESWLPARGRVVEYRAPLAIPQSSVVVVVGDSLRGVVMRSPTHEIVVEPSAHGETRVRSVAPRSVNPTEFVLQYELPATAATNATTFADLEKSGDAFVVVDFVPPDRIVDQLKLEIEGATGIVHAAPMPATLSNERTTLAFRCHPNAGVTTIRAKLTGNIDGRPTVIMKEAIDVSSRARLAPWTATLWGSTRMKHLAGEATKPGAPSPMREEIVELAFKHELASPFTAFFAIPASEASRVEGQLADARRRKRWLAADASDGVAGTITGGAAGAERADYTTAVEPNAPRRGGCAGCVTSPTEGRRSLAGTLVLLAIVAAAVRRRRQR